jgi:hypothetical protein
LRNLKPCIGSTMVCGWANVLGIDREYLAIMGLSIQKLQRNLHHLYSYATKQALL